MRLLIVGDADAAAELWVRELRRAGFEVAFRRVQTASSLQLALAEEWDVVVSAVVTTELDVRRVLEVVRAKSSDLPVLVVSPAEREEEVAALMNGGVNDYLLEGSLLRLGPAVARALRERRAEAARRPGDLTEHHRFGAALEAERTTAIGVLASGLAHEINNPLAYILANLEFAATEVDVLVAEVPGEVRERLGPRIADLKQALVDSSQGAERVRGVMTDLRTFGRIDDASTLVDVRKILDASVRMSAVLNRHRATVVKTYATDVSRVLASESRLALVFLNLIANAAQSLPHGGPLERSRIELTIQDTGDHVHIEVLDTGRGIPAELLARVFEPFFTTRPAGQGTGLGLGLCRRIVAELGGELSLSSELGVGTRALVRLPRAVVSSP